MGTGTLLAALLIRCPQLAGPCSRWSKSQLRGVCTIDQIKSQANTDTKEHPVTETCDQKESKHSVSSHLSLCCHLTSTSLYLASQFESAPPDCVLLLLFAFSPSHPSHSLLLLCTERPPHPSNASWRAISCLTALFQQMEMKRQILLPWT